MSSITKQFIKELQGQELRPVITDSRVLVQGAGWQTSEYFSKYYKDKLSYPLILLVKGNEGIIYIPLSKEIGLVKEIFRKYWNDETTLRNIKNEFDSLGTEADKLYQTLNYKYISENTFSGCLPFFVKFEQVIWDLNTLVFFSIYFDKQIARDLVHELKINITESRFNEVWDRAILPTGISFEKRRMLYLWDLIQKEYSLDDISELCQYFLTSYAKIPSISEVKKHFEKEFSYLSRKQAEDFIHEESVDLDIKKKEYEEWLKQLTSEESKLVVFLQFVMALRDERKDFLMKATTIFYRIGEKLFFEAGIDTSGVYFWSIPEIKKGTEYLIKNSSIIEKRMAGYTLLISDDGSRKEEYGNFERNKENLAEYFAIQHKEIHQSDIDSTVIKGQVGSKGITRGIVKIINNFEEERGNLKKGEILVTGMTRPEYVPLMKMASAIITDEGGITCHAAIVSRELKIPCVIGTKIATKVLKDGDLVEVDADKGIVRIIK